MRNCINKEIVKRTVGAIGNFIKETSRIAIPIAGTLLLSEKTVNKILDEIRYSGNVTYSDAVKAIMNSTMFSSEKAKAVESLKKDGDSEFYKGVISIARSTMFSDDKCDLIQKMSDEN